MRRCSPTTTAGPQRHAVRVELLRRLHGWVRPGARNSVAVALLLAQHDRWPRTIEHWDDGPVVVISPHPDDEAIGCAGAVLLHRQAGARVHIVQVSDGRHGDRRLQAPGLSEPEREALRRQLIATRREEALQWGREAGVEQVHFLDAADGAIGPAPPLVDALGHLLDRVRPQLVYLPFITDLLEDHWQTSRLFQAAAQGATRDGPRRWTADAPRVRGYEVWSPLPANCVADIGAVAARKLALLDIYASQLRDVDYRRAIEGLNRYRSMMLAATGQGHAEAFFEASLRGWLDLMDKRPPGRGS